MCHEDCLHPAPLTAEMLLFRLQREKEEFYPPNILHNSEKYANFAVRIIDTQNIIL